MKLNLQTDFAFRALIFLASQEARTVSIREISDAFRISEAHMVKVVHRLARGGFLESRRGRGGGLRLTRELSAIRIGDVVRFIENDLSLLHCLREGAQDQAELCTLIPVCRLRYILSDATLAMLAVMDRFTLADIVTPPIRDMLEPPSSIAK